MRYAGIGLLLLLLAAPGCMPMTLPPDQPPADVSAKAKVAVKPPPVTADEVTRENAQEIADALQAEVDWALKEPTPDGKPLKARP
jgi:hypothetical protein